MKNPSHFHEIYHRHLHSVKITKIYSHSEKMSEFFCHSRSAETAISAIFGALNSVDLVNSSLQKVQKSVNSNFRASKRVKMANFALQEFSTLISRKI